MAKPYQPATLDEAYKMAEQAKPELDALGSFIQKELGVEFVEAPLKGRARAEEKLASKYQGDPSKLQDLARGRILCDTLEQIDAVRGILAKKAETIRHVDRMDQPNSRGYRDVKYILAAENGTPVELQIQLRCFAEADKQSHPHYEKIRSIIAAAGNRPLTASEQTEINVREKATKFMFEEAARKYNATTKGRKLQNVPEKEVSKQSLQSAVQGIADERKKASLTRMKLQGKTR
ncbi:MAG: hypothetical protein MJ250_03625 [Alphaproteobacteria bacterium]|nr:hypothetical protein [Alphaproteobacteria bacterium]